MYYSVFVQSLDFVNAIFPKQKVDNNKYCLELALSQTSVIIRTTMYMYFSLISSKTPKKMHGGHFKIMLNDKSNMVDNT